LGPNGSGKTTLLEAAYLLSYGRSFRRGSRDGLLRMDASRLQVFAQLRRASGASHRLGLVRDAEGWAARRDEAPLARLSELFAACAVCAFEPGSHELIGGAAEGRRVFLDWGVFHVEPEFLERWRRYQRALRQRNALLRAGQAGGALEPWEVEMARQGEAITANRQRYLDLLTPHLHALADALLPELGPLDLAFDPGWDLATPGGLGGALAAGRDRDRERGSTGRGPHRADWRVGFQAAPRREHLSRGQEKLTALAATLAQARLFQSTRGEWPIVVLDDLASELDAAHQRPLLDALLEGGAQVLISGTETSPALAERIAPSHTFHVEHGRVRPAAGPGT
jgi:DNA replication and repair protein RecF